MNPQATSLVIKIYTDITLNRAVKVYLISLALRAKNNEGLLAKIHTEMQAYFDDAHEHIGQAVDEMSDEDIMRLQSEVEQLDILLARNVEKFEGRREKDESDHILTQWNV